MADTKDATTKHEGYANGSNVIDAATWEGAVARLLEDVETVAVKARDGKTTSTVTAHETDPPEDGRWTRRQPKPGPLPVLVPLTEIAKGAKTVDHEHTVAVDEQTDLDATLYHMARVVVLEARRQHAKGLALREPVVTDGTVVLGVVLVK